MSAWPAAQRRLLPLRPPVRGRSTVVCVAHAGGNPSVFRPLAAALPDDVTLLGARLPGRLEHLGVPPLERIDDIVDYVAAAVVGLPEPVVLIGHSMGALVAALLASRLRRQHVAHLCVSGFGAPHLAAGPGLHALDDASLVDALVQLGGLPAEVAAAPELLALMLPALRADMRAAAGCMPVAPLALDVDITAVAGAHDTMVPAAALDAWAQHTRGTCRTHRLPGGHFYAPAGWRELASKIYPACAAAGLSPN